MADFVMPALGADMATGTVVQWLVEPGSRVHAGDVVAVIETHKGAIDVEIFLDGVIDDLVPVGSTLPVGARLARVREPVGQAAGAADARASAPDTPAAPAGATPGPAATSGSSAVIPPRRRISPAARRRAEAAGLDLGALGEGTLGLADVERALARVVPSTATLTAPSTAVAGTRPPPPAARGGFDATAMRQAIGAAMSRSKREIPHYYLDTTVDFAAGAGWIETYNLDRDPEQRLLPAVLLLKAVARGLAQVPQLNGFFEQGRFRPGAGLHIGWAVSLRGGGLVAPALHDVDRLGPGELMAALRDLVQRARSGGLRSSELTDPTVTVTSLGERGVDRVFGVIVPPQVALVGFGRIVMRPWVVDARVVARPLVALSLAADHRASDGHVGGRLLQAIDQALQQPAALWHPPAGDRS